MDLKIPKIYIKNIEKWLKYNDTNCDCKKDEIFCKNVGLNEECIWVKNLDKYDLSKPGILLIDDNPGIISFLEDDLEELDNDEKINLSDWNIFSFTSKQAAYILIGTLRRYGDLNIKVAIIDITLGGIINTGKKILKLTGIDVFEPLYELNPNLRYLFYTGNQMNHHINTINNIMKQYTNFTGKKITDNILFKTQLSMKDRQTFIYKKLFK